MPLGQSASSSLAGQLFLCHNYAHSFFGLLFTFGLFTQSLLAFPCRVTLLSRYLAFFALPLLVVPSARICIFGADVADD